jgi:hypothetical protein
MILKLTHFINNFVGPWDEGDLFSRSIFKSNNPPPNIILMSVLSGFHRSTDIPTISEETTSFDENNVTET